MPDMGWVEGQDGPMCWRILASPLARAVLGQIAAVTAGDAHLFVEKTWANGAGELGESVYGLKADFRWPAVGEGMSWVAVAMLRQEPQ